MLFNSPEFIIFFVFFTLIYFLLPHRWRWVWILIANIAFYMSFTSYYIILLAVIVIVNYVSAIIIDNNRGFSVTIQKTALASAVIVSLGMLFLFKYFNFFASIVASISRSFGLHYSPTVLNFILPVGISFYTFQSLAYLIEVYRGVVKAERHPGIFAVYMSFFPHILAGPIPRPQKLLPQFREEHTFNPEMAVQGLKLMMWGFFKKVVIADRLAVIVNEVFAHPRDYTGPYLIMASVFFSIQIYCDFSGYSDIAIGLARILGFRLMENFRRPYLAVSINDFWRRWHISLSSWLRDYVYIPLGGSRVSRLRWQINLLVTFLASGIWHGANWTFIVWGLLHGAYIIVGIWTKGVREWFVNTVKLDRIIPLQRAIRVVFTFILVSIAWIFFRSDTLSDAFYILTHLPTRTGELIAAIVTGKTATVREITDITKDFMILGFKKYYYRPEIIIAYVSLTVLSIVEIIQEWTGKGDLFVAIPRFPRLILYYLLTFAVLFFGLYNATQFIYFKF